MELFFLIKSDLSGTDSFSIIFRNLPDITMVCTTPVALVLENSTTTKGFWGPEVLVGADGGFFYTDQNLRRWIIPLDFPFYAEWSSVDWTGLCILRLGKSWKDEEH